MVNKSEKVVNGVVCELNFIRGEEFCPSGDTFLLEVFSGIVANLTIVWNIADCMNVPLLQDRLDREINERSLRPPTA